MRTRGEAWPGNVAAVYAGDAEGTGVQQKVATSQLQRSSEVCMVSRKKTGVPSSTAAFARHHATQL